MTLLDKLKHQWLDVISSCVPHLAEVLVGEAVVHEVEHDGKAERAQATHHHEGEVLRVQVWDQLWDEEQQRASLVQQYRPYRAQEVKQWPCHGQWVTM